MSTRAERFCAIDRAVRRALAAEDWRAAWAEVRRGRDALEAAARRKFLELKQRKQVNQNEVV